MARRTITGALAALRSRLARRTAPPRAAAWPERVLCSDGSAIFVRAVRPDDKERIAGLTDALSEESRFRRYLAPKGRLSSTELAYLTEIDHRDHEALVALDHPAGHAIAVARYVRGRGDPRTAEIAIVVLDGWQRNGVASALLARLAARARENGVRRLTGTVLSHNVASMSLLKGLGPSRVTPEGGGITAVEIELQERRALTR